MKFIKNMLLCVVMAQCINNYAMEASEKEISTQYTYQVVAGAKAEPFERVMTGMARLFADIPNKDHYVKITYSYNAISFNKLKEAFNAIDYRYEQPIHVLDFTDFLQHLCGHLNDLQNELDKTKKELAESKKNYDILVETVGSQNQQLKKHSVYKVEPEPPLRVHSSYTVPLNVPSNDESTFIEEYAPPVLLGISCIAFGLALPKIAHYALPPIKQFIFSYLNRN